MPAALSAWAAAAIAVRLDPATAAMLGVGAGAATLLCAVVLICARRRLALLRVALIILGTTAMVCLPTAAKVDQRSADPYSAAVEAEAQVTVLLQATGEPRRTESSGRDGAVRWVLDAEVLEGTASGQRFRVRVPVVLLGDGQWSQVRHGDVLRAAGRLAGTEPGDRATALLIASTAPSMVQRKSESGDPIDGLREQFLGLSSRTGAPDGGLMPGMVIGARSAVDEELATRMQATGLTHLTAVSGANCSYVLAFVFLVFRGLRFPRWAAAAGGILALAGFVLLVRPEPSVLRAAVMGGIGVLAVLTGRGRLSMTLLFLSIAGLLTADPWLSGEYAFILSVAATSGLVLVGPLLAARLGRYLPVWAAQLVAVPLAAQLFCSPVLVLLQPGMPTYSLLANMAAAPLVPFITILGMVAVVLVPLLPWVALPFAAAAGWGAVWVGGVAGFFASAPFATIPWPGGPVGALLAAVFSTGILLVVRWWSRISALVRTLAGSIFHGGVAPGWALWFAGGGALGLAVTVIWNAASLKTPDWSIAACDVGQGDGFAVKTGQHSAMIFDAGPDPAAMANCLDRLDVTTVDALVLTHLHADHYGGVDGVFANRTVHRVLYSTSEATLPAEVSAAAASGKVMPELISAGAEGAFGSISWSALAPSARGAGNSENNASAVLLVRIAQGGTGDVTALFTGDLEDDAVGPLLAAHPTLVTEGVDILKVAHHGARNGGRRITDAVSPRVALISAGRGNEYGHPHPQTLAALAEQQVHVGRTDLQGTILLTVKGEAVHISPSG
ncbi:ComEC/Rec2 family competence protein [Arthrobacter sp. JZ12]|uniref:ComEC/Rec2 family competence protein n=1 Tax=Arthrobacter sp. JZ12 TaxID=2654190 RepID=UPI002B48B552|nr:ComEC/Rec2 family competence protein [Arthrobacter sp. JZ12]